MSGGPGAVLFDLDGTLYIDDVPIPGAADTIARLRERSVPCRFLTNTTRFSRDGLVERLTSMGIGAGASELFTAPVAAAAWLRGRGIRTIALYLPKAAHVDFEGFTIVPADAAGAPDPPPEAVVVGDLSREWTFDRLNRAFRQILAGAIPVALQKNRFWMTEDGLSLDAGPFVAALEYATGSRAMVVGKPSPDYFRLAADSIGIDPADVLVVGDDIETDVAGAIAAGMRGCLVRTGKFREDTLRSSGVVPDLVVDSIAEVPDLL